MATTTDTGAWPTRTGTLARPWRTAGRRDGQHRPGPAGAAATRAAAVGIGLSALGLGTSLLTIAVLLTSWRVSPGSHVHVTSVAGIQMTYPVANVEAVIEVLLALAGLGVAMRVLLGAGREVVASRRFGRALGDAGIAELASAVVIDDPEPRAFCAGLLRPRVYVTSGAIELLDAQALDAVLLHEHHHVRRRDPLRRAAGRTVARALFFLPWLRALHARELSLAELGADESAVTAAPGNRSALARAMLSFTDASGGGGIDPLRVDYLVGESPNWQIPRSLAMAPLLSIGVILACVVLIGQLAAGSATLAVPVLSRKPCLVTITLLAMAVGRQAVRRVGAAR